MAKVQVTRAWPWAFFGTFLWQRVKKEVTTSREYSQQGLFNFLHPCHENIPLNQGGQEGVI
jgi:hypothetical protein